MSLTRLNLRDGLVNQALSTLMGAGRVFTPGTVLFVDSVTGSDGNLGTEPTAPLATIDAAINATTASKGDLIVVFPKHVETVGGASGITNDVVGVTIVGLGEGGDRPKITFSATASTWVISAASTSVYNIVAVPSIDAVVSPFVVSAADCELDVEVQDASSTVECERAILTTAGANRLKVNLRYQGFTAGNAVVNAVRLVGGTGARINVDFYGKASTSIVEMITTDTVDTQITGSFYNSGTTDLSKNIVDTAASSTWSSQGFDAAAGEVFTAGSAISISGQNTILGKRVQKASATIPGGATQDLFTVAGGRCLVTLMTGEVTTVITSSANLFSIVLVTTVGTDYTLASTFDANADLAGDIYHVEGDGTALVRTQSGVVPSTATNNKFVVAEGTINLTTTQTTGGATSWELWYFPLDDGASIVTA